MPWLTPPPISNWGQTSRHSPRSWFENANNWELFIQNYHFQTLAVCFHSDLRHPATAASAASMRDAKIAVAPKHVFPIKIVLPANIALMFFIKLVHIYIYRMYL